MRSTPTVFLDFKKNQSNAAELSSRQTWVQQNATVIGSYKYAIIQAALVHASQTQFTTGNADETQYAAINGIFKMLSDETSDSDFFKHTIASQIPWVKQAARQQLQLARDESIRTTAKAYVSMAFLSGVLSFGAGLVSNRFENFSDKVWRVAGFSAFTAIGIYFLGGKMMDETPEIYGCLSRVANSVNPERALHTAERVLMGTFTLIGRAGDKLANALPQPDATDNTQRIGQGNVVAPRPA